MDVEDRQIGEPFPLLADLHANKKLRPLSLPQRLLHPPSLLPAPLQALLLSTFPSSQINLTVLESLSPPYTTIFVILAILLGLFAALTIFSYHF